MTFAFYLLAIYTDIQEKLAAEIEKSFQHQSSNNKTTTEDERATLEMLKDMPLLDAVVFETLRLFPPVPTDEKQAAQDDIMPNGAVIEAGTCVYYDIL